MFVIELLKLVHFEFHLSQFVTNYIMLIAKLKRHDIQKLVKTVFSNSFFPKVKMIYENLNCMQCYCEKLHALQGET